jgi:hypothetical protein
MSFIEFQKKVMYYYKYGFMWRDGLHIAAALHTLAAFLFTPRTFTAVPIQNEFSETESCRHFGWTPPMENKTITSSLPIEVSIT